MSAPPRSARACTQAREGEPRAKPLPSAEALDRKFDYEAARSATRGSTRTLVEAGDVDAKTRGIQARINSVICRSVPRLETGGQEHGDRNLSRRVHSRLSQQGRLTRWARLNDGNFVTSPTHSHPRVSQVVELRSNESQYPLEIRRHRYSGVMYCRCRARPSSCHAGAYGPACRSDVVDDPVHERRREIPALTGRRRLQDVGEHVGEAATEPPRPAARRSPVSCD